MTGPGVEWPGDARRVWACLGEIGHGVVRRGSGLVPQGPARQGPGSTRLAAVWQGPAGSGRSWHGGER